jgi:hypothetical protein
VRFDNLLTAAMGNVAVKVQYKDQDGNWQVDEKATAEANEKASKLREEFSSWLWSDPVRKIEMERTFNDVMNAIALPKFDGSFLTFEGMALERGTSPFSMRKHQVDAVWRGLANGRSLNAHEVGTGKTYTAARLLALQLAVHAGPAPLRVALAAPTGKAAARLKQSIDKALVELPVPPDLLNLRALVDAMGPARTLHSLLGARPDTRRMRHHAAHPLDVDVLMESV